MRGGGWDMLSSTCVQSSGVHLGGYDPARTMEAGSPAPATWIGIAHSQVKQEPLDNDSSAYGSGSDAFSSSPASDSRDSHQVPYTHSLPQYYTPNRIPTSLYQPINGFNPLTPPSFEPISPKTNGDNFQEQNNTLTPCTTPPTEVTPPKSPKQNVESEEDHLRRLQMAFERNMLPNSPKGSDNMEDDSMMEEMEEVDEQGLKVPAVNSHGKIKTFKCKQCGYVAVTKLDFWEHSRGHIKADKLLTCPKCPFVTEYKHHLEYHLRNHFGSKPFKCDKCNYSCVNKSMLNSHLKSHSNIYQYRCADCTYATKYCHSLKLHLRKYKHSPAMVLNPDGTPNPLPIIDVYGTRRGPKQKHLKDDDMPQGTPIIQQPQHQHSIFSPFMLPTSQPNMPLPFPYPLLGAFSNPLLFPQVAQGQISPSPSNDRSTPESLKIDEDEPPNDETKLEETKTEETSALDLSKPEITLPINVPEVPVSTPIAPANPAKNRRKGRAFKLERITKEASSDEEIIEKKQEIQENVQELKINQEIKVNKASDIFNCQYCDIAFRDVVMYTMHMGYHGYKDPFTCNMCGEQSADKVSFFLHIARTSHS